MPGACRRPSPVTKPAWRPAVIDLTKPAITDEEAAGCLAWPPWQASEPSAAGAAMMPSPRELDVHGTSGGGVESARPAKVVAAAETQGIEVMGVAVVSDGDVAHICAACGAVCCAAILLYRMSSSSALDRFSAVDTLLADALVVALGSTPTEGVSTTPAVVGSTVAAFLRRMWSISI